MTEDDLPPSLDGIAIIGMAGRFPGARSVAEFWRNQLLGRESISHFTVEELEIADRDKTALREGYVRARAVLEDADLFDAEFFGIYPREATLMDPQQRLFLESCWEAFEDAGYDPAVSGGSAGVFAGCSIPTYFLSTACKQPGFLDRFTGDYQAGSFPELLGNGLDFLATKVGHKLNLHGPCITLLTACSTSLVAVSQACQSLLTYQCDMALAGGASISFPQKRGTNFIEGGMTSPDGHCRAFDANANGTVFGSGAAVVLLKRLDEAVRDRDHIYAVIRGFGLSNDGARKVGYTAPSVDGEAQAIRAAYALAGVDPRTIGYVEAHGTGTSLGDPIELQALTQVHREHTADSQYCVIGTAKTNIGHLDAAAGVTGLIHATHIVKTGLLPPTLHYSAPNPKFDLEASPFKVNTETRTWDNGGEPRRAAVSAFGVGGTNAHVVIEQSPELEEAVRSDEEQLLVLSARSGAALASMQSNLASHLEANPEANLADMAWTLQVGRQRFAHAAAIVASSRDEAIAALRGDDASRTFTSSEVGPAPKVTFLFPGQGAQYVGMGRGLYDGYEVFRTAVDTCSKILEPILGSDLRDHLYPKEGVSDAAQSSLSNTALAQPAIFTVEYALARLWMSFGITPQRLIGHSVGEFAAAVIADVMTLDDALRLVAERGRLMQEMAPGAMLSVRLAADDLRPLLASTTSIAAINAPKICVAAGPHEDIDALEARLKADGVTCRRLVTSHAFHSPMMDPAVSRFMAAARTVRLNAPTLEIVSTVTGAVLTSRQATDPNYWGEHLRKTVNFSAAMAAVRRDPGAVLLEVGPGNTLNTLARQHDGAEQTLESSLPGPQATETDRASLLQAVAALWLAGLSPDWEQVHGTSAAARRRVSLPTYPFERKRFWLDVATRNSSPSSVSIPSQPLMEPTPMAQVREQSPATASVEASTSATTRRQARIEAALKGVFEDLSGTDLAGVGSDTTFLEMGFDSLFLTQVTRDLKNKFNLKITFRQLLGAQNTFGKLAALAATVIPASDYADPAEAAVNTPAPAEPAPTIAAPMPAVAMTAVATAAVPAPLPISSAGAGESALERMMQSQLSAMQQIFSAQIGALGGYAAPAAQSAIPAAVPAAAAAPLAAPSASPSAAPAAKAPELKLVSSAREPQAEDKTATSSQEFKAFGPYKPVQAKLPGALSDAQSREIAKLVGRFAEKCKTSKRITETHRKSLADPRVVSGFRADWKDMIFPVTTSRSKGSKLWDVDGNEYIDILNGFGPIMFGHRPDFIEAAIEQQLREGIEIGPQTPLAGEIAELFCEITGNERMTFCNTGSEAVMAAMRVARTVTGRDKVVLFTGDYHGMFDEVLVKAGRTRAGDLQANPIAPGIPRESVANMVVLDYGTDESLAWIRDNADDLAAVLVEPVQSRRPGFRPVEFLKRVREITEASGTALVFDEVVTGFRTHPGGCQALFGIRADMATYGKVLGGGMPIGVLAGRSTFMDALDGGEWHFGDASIPEVGVTFFAGTFVRHPLTLAAVRAVLQKIKSEGPDFQKALGERTTAMIQRINAIFDRYAIPTRIENFTSFFYFSFPQDERLASLFYYLLRENGVHVLEGFPCFLTSAHSDADIEKVVAAFEAAAREARRAGFISAPWSGSLDDLTPGAAGASPLLVPMTEPQREIFLAAMLGEDASCAFNESFTLTLDGRLDADNLKQAFADLIKRHEALRAVVDRDGEHLRIEPALSIPLVDVDHSHLSADAALKAYDDLLAQDARTPFDLHEGPLVRGYFVTRGQDAHALVVTAHHIVCDGWSVNVILEDLSRLYSARVAGSADAVEAAESFRSYAKDQKTLVAGEDFRANEAFWLEAFRDVPAPHNLPTNRPRGEVRTYNGTTLRRRIGEAAYRSIKDMGARQGASLFATLLAGFDAVVHRFSGDETVVVGVPLAGQSQLSGGPLVGHCVNFLPLKARVTREMSFAELLTQVSDTVLDAYEHQGYTYGTLVRALDLKRDRARLPLTELQFNVEQIGSGLSFKGLAAKVEPNPKAAVNSDIFVNVVETKDGLDIDCDFNTDLFDEDTINSWLDAFELSLLAATKNPKVRIADLDIGAVSTTPERSASPFELYRAVNDTATAYPSDKSVAQLFEEQVAANPDATALTFNGTAVTYAELNAQANRIANHLIAAGVGAEEFVGCALPRSPELVATVLAILKAGAAYVPLDASLPSERLAFMIADTGTRVIVTRSGVELPDLTAARILLDDPASGLNSASAENPMPRATPDSLAYVCYTSGSTGRPKGVLVEHRAIVRLVRETNYCRFNRDTAILMNAPVSFDASTFEIWGPLLNGGRVVIMPPGDPSLVELGRTIREGGVTALFLTAGLFHVMVEQRLEDLAGVKQLMTGGEVVSPAHAQKVVSLLPDTEMINIYGPTECTTYSTFAPFAPKSTLPTPLPIGKPLSNARIYIVDEAMQLLPQGSAGELVIAGDGLARGYLNLPEITAERFVTVRLLDREERVYRTGDRARLLATGDIEFLGRMDDQIKLRGFRIELGEIETALRSVPAVEQAIAVAEFEEGRAVRLLAFVSAREGSVLAEDVIRHHLASKVPAYMVPAVIKPVDAFPLTQNGKVDKAKLLASVQVVRTATVRELPATAEEKILGDIVAEILHLPHIGPTDNLFELGVDSLKIFQITSRAAKAGLTITPRIVLEARTIRDALKEAAKAPEAKKLNLIEIKPVARRRTMINGQGETRLG